MNKFLLLVFVLITNLSISQVGIGTPMPSDESVLDINSSTDGGLTFKGMLPPRVPNITARNTITPNNTTDVGMLIFLTSSGCLQVWNGNVWENVHCNNSLEFSGVVQNFDLGTTWCYTSDIAFFDNGTLGFYGITTAANSIFSNLTSLTNNFLGIRDLDDTEDGNGTTGLATITFNTIDVSTALSGTTVVFDYQTFRLDNGDDAFYTVIIDGIAQTTVQFINAMADSSNTGTISVAIAGGTSTVGLVVAFEQAGATDVFGFDNFRIIPN